MRTLSDVLETASEIGKPFWSAMAEGRLDLPLCNACKKAFFHPRKICPNCWASDIGWTTSKGAGTVWSLTVNHTTLMGVTKEDLPFAAGLVDLDDGVRLPAYFSMNALPKIGQRVQCTFPKPGQFPVFMPAA